MKKLSAICLLVCLLAALSVACLPASAADDLYSAANDGDLLYSVNFYGDERYSPAKTLGNPIVEVDPLDHGKVTISTANDKTKNRWGGEISGLPLNEGTAYTMYYTVTRESDDGALGVYGDDHYGVYGYSYNQRFLEDAATLTGHNTITYADANIKLDSNLKTNGGVYPSVQEYAIEFNGQRYTMKVYIKDSTGNWVLIDETADTEILIFYTENLGFYMYVYWANKAVTVSDVNIYKGMLLSGEKLTPIVTTEPQQTTPAPVTTPEPEPQPQVTTPASTTPEPTPEVTTPAPTADTTTAGTTEKGGCGSAVALSLLAALVPAGMLLRGRK